MRLSFNCGVVMRYRMYLEQRKLAPGTITLRLGAVRRLTDEGVEGGLLSPDLAADIRHSHRVQRTATKCGSRAINSENTFRSIKAFSRYKRARSRSPILKSCRK